MLLAIAALSFGGCAQSPQQLAASPHAKEYFPSSVYGPASRRVIADGQPVPHGGGQYLVGKPYTIAGQTYYPSERKITQVGLASWYGDAFHGRLTANGEIYDRGSFSAAHPTMPLPSYARVTNLRNGYSMIVRVNDRGPYHSNRVMDVSSRVADTLDFKRYGTSRVKVEYVGRASLAGSDDAKLYASLRTDGPASVRGLETNTMVAEAAPQPARVASLAPYVPQTTYSPAPRSPAFDEDDRTGAIEPAERPHRQPPRMAAREEAGAVENTPAFRHAVTAPAPFHATREPSQLATRRSPSWQERPALTNDFGSKHPVRMASRDDGAAARAFASHGLMPPVRPGRAGGHDEGRFGSRAAPAPRGSALVMPPSRPVRLAANEAGPRHHTGGSHPNHSRDD